jgi:hypothetical protein
MARIGMFSNRGLQLWRFLSFACLFCGLVTAGCSSSKIEYSQVSISDRSGIFAGSPTRAHEGKVILIKDKEIANHMATFFPGMGTGRRSFWVVGLIEDATLTFTRSDTGETITVETINGGRQWRSDAGDMDSAVNGDIMAYMRAILYTPLVLDPSQNNGAAKP